MKPLVKHHIFERSACPGNECLLLYADGRLPHHEMHRLEAHLVDCPLCSDAVEGLALVPGTTMPDQLMKEGSAMFKRVAAPKTNEKWRVWMAAASLAVIISSVAWLYHNTNQPSNERVAEFSVPEPITAAPVEPEKKNEIAVQPQTIVDTIPHSVTSGAMQKQLQVATGINNEAAVTAAPEQQPEVTEGKASIAESDEIHRMSEKNVAPASADVAAFKLSTVKSKNSQRQIRYIEGLKTLAETDLDDYADSLLVPGNMGVEARFENEVAKKDKTEDQVHFVSYSTLLENGIRKFKGKKYKEAVEIFSHVLAARSDDENALFYGALSYKGLKRFEKARMLLGEIVRKKDAVFYEEAKWNLALVHLDQGNEPEAKGVLNEIVVEKGFYATQASEKLKEINN